VALICLLPALVGLESCAQKQAAASAPPPEPRVIRPARPPQPSEPVSEPQTVAALPSPQPVPPEAIPETPGPLVAEAAPEISPPPQPAPPRPVPVAPPVNNDSAAPPEAPPPSVPQLGQMLSPDQRRQYTQAIDQAMRRTQDYLDIVTANSARLNDEQQTTVRRIRAFVQQAKEARNQDLTIAKSLADRAMTLAEDLARNFK
jgi:hypothetical protein